MKRLLTFLTLLTLFFGVGWAETATITFGSSNRDVSSNSATTVNGFTITCTGDNNWSDNNDVRFMGNSTMTIDGGTKTITSIVFNTTSRHFSSASADVGICTVGTNSMTWTGSSTSVTVTNTGSAQARITNIVITYTAGQTEPDPTTPSGSITFTPSAGEVTSGTTVAMSFSGTCTGIKYTTNGDTPDDTNGTVYNASNPPVITGSTTIKAAAYNYSNSKYAFGSVATAEYTVTIPSVDYDGTATFDATKDKDLQNATAGEGTITKAPVTFTCSNGILGNGSEYRLYKNSNTTFSVPANSGYKIVKIEFTGESGNPVSGFGTTQGLIINGDDGTWTGETESVSFTASGAQVRCTLINVYYTEPSANEPVYYLVGTFNNWNQNADYKFTKSGDSYVLNGVDLPDNAEFQINKVVDGETTWFGGATYDNVYGIHGGHHENIGLGGNKNFKIEAGAITNFSFTVDGNDNPSVLNVNRDAQFFVKGDFNGWNREAMTATATGWTIEHVISSANQFGFVDEWGYWYGGRDWWIQEEHLDTELEIKPDGNFYMNIAGTDDYTLTVNSAKTTLTVSKIEVPTVDEYELVTDASTLSAGDRVIITNSGSAGDAKAMSTTQNNNNRGSTAVTITGDLKVTPGTDVQIFNLENTTLTGSGNAAWMFNTGSNTYIYAQSSSSNNLRTGTATQVGENGKASITIENKIASIVFQGTNTRNVLQYNSPSNLFSCYGSASQSPVYLYKKVEVEEKSTPPVITPASQNVKGGLLEGVNITAAEGATIYYTRDGSEPTVESEEFDGQAFNIEGTGGERKMVRAIAVEANKAPSYPASVTYTFQAPSSPTISPDAGTYEEAVTVTISSTDGGTIYYLVDPKEAPTNAAAVIDNGQVYDPDETEIILSENGTHKVYAAVNLNGITSWAQASYTINIPVTLNPPVFFDDFDQILSDGDRIFVDDPIWIGSENEDGTIYYVIDPNDEPTAAYLCENGEPYDYDDGVILPVGQHTIYAVVELNGNFSIVTSVTVNVVTLAEEGEWQLVGSLSDINPMCEYIIVNADYNMAVGSYGNGHFNAVACENNVTFGPYNLSATVNSTDVKTFSFEGEENGTGGFNIFLKDADDTYYSFGSNVSDTKSPISINVNENFPPYVVLSGTEASSNLAYGTENFGMYVDGSPILMYYRMKPLTLTLKEIVRDMEMGNVTIADELVAVKCLEVKNGIIPNATDALLLFCKDLGNAWDKTENTDSEVQDYMIANHFFNGEWDQSNWVALVFNNVSQSDGAKIKGYEGMHIKPGTVTGGYINYEDRKQLLYMNTTNLVEVESSDDTEKAEYTPNLYSPANFLPYNLDGGATGHGDYADRHYFFVNPKIEEYCEITFAVWKESENHLAGGYFTLPAADGVHNITDIYGAIAVDWSYNEYDQATVTQYLNNNYGKTYRFKAIVEGLNSSSKSPMLKDDETSDLVDPQDDSIYPIGRYIVYPVDFKPEESIITGIEAVNMLGGNGEVKSIKYVNVAGIVSDKPFQGVNIVVTEYTDGIRTTTKMLRK